MKFSIFSLPSSVTSYKEAVDFAAEASFEAIEPYCDREFATPDIEAAKQIRAYAENKGISISCFSIAVSVVGENRRAEIDRLKKYIDVAKALGSPYLHHTIAPGLSHKFVRMPYGALLQKAVEALKEISDYGKERGVKCMYENQGYIFNGSNRLERLIEAADFDFGIVADVGNSLFVGERAEVFVGRFAPFIEHVHVKDYLFHDGRAYHPGEGWMMTREGDYLKDCIMGMGVVNFAKIFRILKNAGYQGYYSLEYCGGGDAKAAINMSATNLAQIYKDS